MKKYLLFLIAIVCMIVVMPKNAKAVSPVDFIYDRSASWAESSITFKFVNENGEPIPYTYNGETHNDGAMRVDLYCADYGQFGGTYYVERWYYGGYAVAAGIASQQATFTFTWDNYDPDQHPSYGSQYVGWYDDAENASVTLPDKPVYHMSATIVVHEPPAPTPDPTPTPYTYTEPTGASYIVHFTGDENKILPCRDVRVPLTLTALDEDIVKELARVAGIPQYAARAYYMYNYNRATDTFLGIDRFENNYVYSHTPTTSTVVTICVSRLYDNNGMPLYPGSEYDDYNPHCVIDQIELSVDVDSAVHYRIADSNVEIVDIWLTAVVDPDTLNEYSYRLSVGHNTIFPYYYANGNSFDDIIPRGSFTIRVQARTIGGVSFIADAVINNPGSISGLYDYSFTTGAPGTLSLTSLPYGSTVYYAFVGNVADGADYAYIDSNLAIADVNHYQTDRTGNVHTITETSGSITLSVPDNMICVVLVESPEGNSTDLSNRNWQCELFTVSNN